MANHTLSWTDIPVTDLDRAITFYSAILAAPVERKKHEDFEFGLLPLSGEKVSGCLAVCSDNQPSRTGPLIYLSVDGRLDAAAEAAGKNGGRILVGKQPIGPWGFRAIILDSEGNRIALHSTTE